jgi:hypothetical protein
MLRWLLLLAVVALVGTGVATVWSVWRFRRTGDAFRCRIRAGSFASARWPRPTRRWSRRMWAAWDDDVLVLRRGPVRARTIRVPATVSAAGVYVLRDEQLWSGQPQLAVCLRRSDGSRLEVAAGRRARVAMVGPYVAAAMNDLPRAPVPRRQTRRQT